MNRLKILMAAAIMVLLVLPLWIVHYPPLADYPNHLARAFILANPESPNLSAFYEPGWGLYPYLTMDGILVLAQKVMPLPLAGRLLLTVGVLAVPLSCWFFLRAANPGAERLSLFSLLICYNPLFRSGFVNWYLSLSVLLLVLGIWLRFVHNPRRALWVGFLVSVVVLYFTHIVSFAVAGFVVFIHGVFSKQSFRKILLSLLPFIPGVLLYLYWRSTGHMEMGFLFYPLSAKVLGLAVPMRTFSRGVDILVCSSTLVCVVWLFWRNRDLKWNRVWVLTLSAFAALYLVSPDIFGTFLVERLAYAVLILALTVASPGPRLKKIMPMVLLIFLVQVSYVGATFLGRQKEMKSLQESFTPISRGSRVLPIVQSRGEPLSERFYGHFWAYGILVREFYSPYVMAARGINPHPLKFRISSYSPKGFGWLDYGEDVLDWKRIAADYDFVWAYNVPHFQAALSAIGVPVFTNGNVSVYRIMSESSEPRSVLTDPGFFKPTGYNNVGSRGH